MISNSKKLIATLGTLLLAGSVSFAQTKSGTDSASQPSRQGSSMATGSSSDHSTMSSKDAKMEAAAQSLKPGQDYQVLTFKKGQVTLTDQEQTDLKDLVDNAKAKGKIDKVIVTAWADKPFPKGKKADLSSEDKKIADQRLDAVNKYLKDILKVSNTDTYSLAEQSNWFAKAFNTTDAELKSMFGQQGAPQISQPEFMVVKQHGGPMKSVIVIQHEKSGSSTTGTSSSAE